MKSVKTRRTLTALAISICALAFARLALAQTAAKNFSPSRSNGVERVAPGTEDVPKSLDELLADPLFKLDPNATADEIVAAAGELARKFNRFLYNSEGEALRNVAQSPEKQFGSRENIIKKEILRIANAYGEKYNAEIMPKLLPIITDDDFAMRDDGKALEAFASCLYVLARSGSGDELAKIHETEVARWRDAAETLRLLKEQGDDEKAIRDAENVEKKRLRRLVSVDNYRLALVFQPFYDQLEGTPIAQTSDEARQALLELGDQLAEEVKSDPFLIQNCDQCFLAIYRRLGEDPAMEYRDKFRASISLEDAKDAYRRLHGHDVGDDVVIIYRPDSFDESLFDIPENETPEFYFELGRKINAARMNAKSAPVRKAVKDAYDQKAADALAKLALLTTSPSKLAQSSAPAGDDAQADDVQTRNQREFERKQRRQILEETSFTPETILALKEEIATEAAKPLDQANVEYLALARAAVLNYELEEAVKADDRDAALKACETFAERAEFNNEAARILVQTLEDFGRRYKKHAPALVDAALARAELSNGALAIYTLRLIKLKENVAPR